MSAPPKVLAEFVGGPIGGEERYIDAPYAYKGRYRVPVIRRRAQGYVGYSETATLPPLMEPLYDHAEYESAGWYGNSGAVRMVWVDPTRELRDENRELRDQIEELKQELRFWDTFELVQRMNEEDRDRLTTLIERRA